MFTNAYARSIVHCAPVPTTYTTTYTAPGSCVGTLTDFTGFRVPDFTGFPLRTMVRQFAPPVNVAPLIRFGRWGMLFTGIVYGAYRHRSLQNYEDERKRQRNNDRITLEATSAPGKGGANDDACSADRQNTVIAENPIPADLKNITDSLVPKDPSDERRKVVVIDNPISSDSGEINPAKVPEDPTNSGRNVVIDNPISAVQKKTDSAATLKDPFDEHRNSTIFDVNE